MVFELSYFGHDGLHRETSFNGNADELARHITALEERGAHGIEAVDAEDAVIYTAGGFISRQAC